MAFYELKWVKLCYPFFIIITLIIIITTIIIDVCIVCDTSVYGDI